MRSEECLDGPFNQRVYPGWNTGFTPVASGRRRVKELTHFPPSNRAELTGGTDTAPPVLAGPGEGSPSARLTEPAPFDYKAFFIYTPAKTAQGKQRRRQRSTSRTAAGTAGGPRGARLFSASCHRSHLCAPTAATRATGTPAAPIPAVSIQQRPPRGCPSCRRCRQPPLLRAEHARSRAISSPSRSQEPPWQWFQSRLSCL